MELRQLEYFAAVARHRHFTRAAEALYVTQSALSQQVRRLEAELGLALLSRTPKGVELTAAGADLLARAEAVLAEVAAARAEMDQHAGALRGVVRVAATTADTLRLPPALAAFHLDHPGVGVALRQGSAGEVVDLVRRGAADLALAALEAGDAGGGLDVAELAAEPLVAVLAPGDELAERGPVALWDLRDRPFVLPEDGTALRRLVMEVCNGAGFSPLPRFEVSDPAAVRALVHAGLGIALVPAGWLEGDGPAVAPAALAGAAPAHRLFLVAPAAGSSPAAALLREHLRSRLAGPPG
jgi:DNA-binding transcriptional LysR family regulator